MIETVLVRVRLPYLQTGKQTIALEKERAFLRALQPHPAIPVRIMYHDDDDVDHASNPPL